MSSNSLGLVALLVHDYDEAIRFYTQALRFRLREDSDRGGGRRWVVVAPGEGGAGLVLVRAEDAARQALVGRQCGDSVFLFLDSADFWSDYAHMRAHGVRFAEEPREEAYGTVVVFHDLYGTKWDLLQRK
ncbi:VOC family protein [Tahibacter harae]|uniref:VOC family protein n=1 Tax=Tahibacter harae TaxID=2963937 RepID=A0ABT1QQN0_9GAMM|nr:VOC family protein [Tahibacter harae]MCQ4164556.1 VOC family protein [Tahibacter harae]